MNAMYRIVLVSVIPAVIVAVTGTGLSADAATPEIANSAIGSYNAAAAGHVSAATSSSNTSRGQFVSPVRPFRVTDPFRAPVNRYGAGHRGVDLAALPGQEVFAPAAGTISFVGVVVDRGVLTIDHGGGLLSSIEPITSGLSKGTGVTAGQPLGTVSSGGHCSDRCVHFGVRLNGEYVSPMLYLGGVPRAILLPWK